MSFKYINPGYGELLTVAGTTVQNSDYNPDNGVAFWQSDNTQNLTLPASVQEIWIKFDLYVTSNDGPRIYVYDYQGSVSTGVRVFQTYVRILNYSSTVATTVQGTFTGHHTYILHVKSAVSGGIFDLYCDGAKIYTFSGSVNSGYSIGNIRVNSAVSAPGNYFSNLIISDTEIKNNEKIVILPLKDKLSDWSDQGNGTIKATAVGQTLRALIDVDSLNTVLSARGGNNIDIQAVSIGAQGVLYDSTAVNALASSVTNGGRTQNIETVAIANNAMRGSGQSVNPLTGSAWALSEIETLQVQLTAKEV